MTGEPNEHVDDIDTDADDADEHDDEAPPWADLGPRDDLPDEEVVRRAAQPSPHPDTTTTQT